MPTDSVNGFNFLTERRYSILDFAAFMAIIYIAGTIIGLILSAVL